MTDEDLCYTPATELAALIRQKKLSPVEVTRTVLDRIARVDPKINAFVTVTAGTAMESARAAEAALMGGDELGPLHGVPVTVKDLTATKGVPTKFGSHTMADNVPEVDAPLVTRMKQAGAVILGKTTTPEFGWKGVSQSPLTGITHNPWKHGYNSGASSAGAAAAACAGMGPLHQGGDGAGSIRMPAHFSGVFGIKPTFGRIPAYPVANTDNTSHLGPITRTVADAALMLETLAGPHPWDHTTVEPWPADFSARLAEGIKGTRIAWSPDLGHARVDPEVASLVEAAVGVLQDTLGANVEPVVPDWGKNGPDIMRFHWAAHYGQFVGLFPQWESQMDPGFVACVRSAADRPVSDYQLMRQRKLAYVLSIHRFFEDWDFMVTPAVSVAAFPADRLQPEHWPQHPWDWLSWAEFSYPFNLSGNPAAVVPCGFTKDGLPVGLQIIGRRFNDLGVMQAAAAFEQARPWAQHRPPLN